MTVFTSVLATVTTLLGVALGGWLASRGQDRGWKRDHDRQWRDIRLTEFGEFARAYRA